MAIAALSLGTPGETPALQRARALGVAVQRHRLIIIAAAVVLTSAAVSAAGPIEFVAFVAPQIARRQARTARPPASPGR